MDHESPWEMVFEARNHAEAGMVRGLLEGQGYVVMHRGRFGLPHLGSSEPVLLLVPVDQAEAARDLIAAYLSAPSELHDPDDPNDPSDQNDPDNQNDLDDPQDPREPGVPPLEV